MRLKNQIYLSFGSMLALMVIISLVGTLGLLKSADSFSMYEKLSTDTNIASELPTSMYAVQSAANRYLTTRETRDLVIFEEQLDRLDAALQTALTNITAEGRGELVVELNDKVTEYKGVFNELAAKLRRQVDLAAGELEPLESKLINTLDYLISSSHANSDLNEVYYAAQVREQLLLGLLSVARFISSSDLIDYEDAVSEIGDKLSTYRSSLDLVLDSESGQRILAEFNEAHLIYLQLMKDIRDLSSEVQLLVETRLNPINDSVASLTEKIAASLEKSQTEAGDSVRSYSQLTILVKLAVSVVALVIGLVLIATLVKRIWSPLGAEPTQLLSIIEGVSGGDIDSNLNPDNEPVSGVFAGLIKMQGQMREARTEREHAADIKIKAQLEKEQKEAEARAHELQLRDAELLEAEMKRVESIELQKRVDSLLSTVQAAASGDLTQPVSVKGDDAVGKIGEGLEKLLSTLNDSINKFRHTAGMLNTSSEQLSSLNNELSESANHTARQSDIVSTSANQISDNIDSVAVAVEQMSASIKGIAANSTEAANVAQEAVSLASDTDSTVRQLSKSSTDIGAVVKVINSIAEQTNLLALNATIEAARAGDAGKGFAVVANEVKDLAKETAKATDEISKKVSTIQSDSQDAVGAIADISDIILRINQYQTTIATAVKEQSATTTEMSRTIAETSQGSGEIALNVSQVAETARENLSSVDSVKTTAAELFGMSNELDRLVGQYKL